MWKGKLEKGNRNGNESLQIQAEKEAARDFPDRRGENFTCHQRKKHIYFLKKNGFQYGYMMYFV